MKINKPIPKLTRDNLSQVLYDFPCKTDLGFNDIEILKLLNLNKIEFKDFIKEMSGKTYTKIDNIDVYYKTDVVEILYKLIK